MARAIWSGVITFGMVSIPVELYPAVQEKDVHFHRIHKACGSRISLQKYCPVDKRVVTDDELVRGYEISKGHYVLMEDEDFENLPVPAQHAVTITSFAKADEIDPVYYDTSYQVRPSEIGRKPFALLIRAMKDRGDVAVGQIVLRSKESLCVIRSAGETLMLETLFYPDELRKAESVSSREIRIDDRELRMATSLVDLLEEKFDPSKYHDEYREALLERIESKANGHEVEQPPTPERSDDNVIDIMDALKKSIESAKKRKTG